MDFFIRLFLFIYLIINTLDLPAQDFTFTGDPGLNINSGLDMMKKEGVADRFGVSCNLNTGAVPFIYIVSGTHATVPSEINREFLTGSSEPGVLALPAGRQNDYRHGLIKRKTNTPWLALAAVPFAAGGLAAHFRTKALHEDYMQSAQTDEAVKLRDEVKQMQLIRNVSFGVAGLLGITGTLFYRKQYQNNKRVRIEYLPFAYGGTIGLTF